MNKSDMLKEAEKMEALGVDPDTIMVTHTLDEYAEMHGDEVDTLDEDRKKLCDLQDALREVIEAIEIAEDDLKVTEELEEKSNNYMQRTELREDIKDLNRRISSYRSQKEKLIAQIEELKENMYKPQR